MRILSFVTSVALFCFSSASYAGDEEANALFVEAVKSYKSITEEMPPLEKLEKIDFALEKFDEIAEEHPSSNLAVMLITGQAVGDISPAVLQAERDRIMPEVEEVIAQQDAQERHKTWVEETLTCVKNRDCFEDLHFEMEIAGRDISEASAEEIELYKKFSFMPAKAAYDGLSRELLSDFAEFDVLDPGGLYLFDPFHLALSFAILHDDPEDVFEVRQKYGKPERPRQFADPMRMAAYARNFDKAEEYRAKFEEWVGEDEFYTSDSVFQMQLYYDLSVEELRNAAQGFEDSGELTETAPWEVLMYLADHNSDRFLDAFEQYDPVEYGYGAMVFSKLIYHALQGEPKEGVAFYLSQKEKMEAAGEEYDFVARIGLYELALITIDRNPRGGAEAVEVLLQENLNLIGKENLDKGFAKLLTVASAALQ